MAPTLILHEVPTWLKEGTIRTSNHNTKECDDCWSDASSDAGNQDDIEMDSDDAIHMFEKFENNDSRSEDDCQKEGKDNEDIYPSEQKPNETDNLDDSEDYFRIQKIR